MSNKWSEYQRGRQDGLSLALDIVKKGGLEALEKEIQFRGKTGINTGIAMKELNKAAQPIKERTLDTFTILGVAALHDCFGFGQTRCQRWIDKIDEGADYLIDDFATWDDYINEIREQLNLTLDIRWR